MGEPEFYKNKQASVPSSAKERAQVLSVNKKSLNRAVKKAYDLTEWNNHNEALQVFSKYFKYDDITRGLKDNLKAHNEAGHLTQELYEQRNGLSNELFSRIKRDYGEDVLKQVYKGLQSWQKENK